MPESMNQQLLDRVEDLLFSIQCLYEQVIEMNNLPADVRGNFLEWHGTTVDFLREQKDILLSRISLLF